ncbi:hypothetical protein BGW38_004653, partial [Lunasporangiospora selenospora]
LIFVLAFRKLFGLPDFTERFFPGARFPGQSKSDIQPAEGLAPLKTTLVGVAPPQQRTRTTKTPSSTAVPTAATTTVVSAGDTKTTANQRMVTTESTNGSPKVSVKPARLMPYTKELDAMEAKFREYIDNPDIWEKVFDESSPGQIQVYQYKARPMCYKIHATMNNTVAVTFDTLCALEKRLEWDPMCVEAKVLTQVEERPGTSIQYVRTKAVWPTASRDTVVLGTVKELADGQLMMVNASIDYDGMPERIKEKIVRMETSVAVSTKAVPESIRNVNALIPKIEPYHASLVMARIASERKKLKDALEDSQSDHLPQEHGESQLKDEDKSSQDKEPSTPQDLSELSPKRDTQHRHELRNKRSEGSMTLETLSDRLRAVEDEVGLRERPQRLRNSTRQETSTSLTSTGGGGSSKVLEKAKPAEVGMFRTLWDGVKEQFGFGTSGKMNKILVAVILVTILGTSAARLKRR